MKTLVLAALTSAAISACSRAPAEFHRRFLSLGTLVDVTIYGADPTTAKQAVAAVETMLDRFDARWNPWGSGTLARLNAAIASGHGMHVDATMAAAIRHAATLSVMSERLFDPGIGAFTKLWQFNLDARPAGAPPPDGPAVAAVLRTHPSITNLTISADRISSNNRHVTLDFGGYAKGLAVDRAIGILKAHGIHNAIVNAGGDLRAIGRHGTRAWRIGIENPRVHGGVLASVEVSGDECVFTSGDYERYFIYRGVRYSHIFDPRTGYPAQGTISVTVIGSGGADDDAAATALFVAGPGDWQRIARKLGIHAVMLVDSKGVVHMTPTMAARTRFEGKRPPVEIVAP